MSNAATLFLVTTATAATLLGAAQPIDASRSSASGHDSVELRDASLFYDANEQSSYDAAVQGNTLSPDAHAVGHTLAAAWDGGARAPMVSDPAPEARDGGSGATPSP
jgi:hypothetical protein